MAGNTFGQLFTVTSFGESHGPALGCVVDGCPPGLALSEEDIQRDVERRRSGTSRYTSQRREPDTVRILSGVFEGRTTGTPIGLLVMNEDQRSYDYDKIKDRFRPGHADYTYQHKYGFRDYRGGGRSSARETVMRVAAGAIARKYLAQRLGVQISGYLAQVGDLRIEPKDMAEVDRNPFFCPDAAAVGKLEALIDQLRREGDSIGARVTVVASGVPPGLGEPVFDRLDALHRVDAHHGVREVRVEPVEYRFTEPGGHAAGHDRDTRADRVALAAQLIDQRLEPADRRGVGAEERVAIHFRHVFGLDADVTHLGEVAGYPHTEALCQVLPGDCTGRDPHHRLPRRGPPAAAIVAKPVLVLVRVVGVAGAESILDLVVVVRALVLVLDLEPDRSPGRAPLEDARENPHPVRLTPLARKTRGARTATLDVALDVVLVELQPRRATVHDAAQRRAVTLAERRHRE